MNVKRFVGVNIPQNSTLLLDGNDKELIEKVLNSITVTKEYDLTYNSTLVRANNQIELKLVDIDPDNLPLQQEFRAKVEAERKAASAPKEMPVLGAVGD